MFGIRSGDSNNSIHEDGLADTLHNLILHDNYVNRGQTNIQWSSF